MLQSSGVPEPRTGPNVVARLKVMADLLTYRIDIPQEGRIRQRLTATAWTCASAPFHDPRREGGRAPVRCRRRIRDLEQLGFPAEIGRRCTASARADRRHSAPHRAQRQRQDDDHLRLSARSWSRGGRHIVTIEDPVEQAIEGTSQSQARPGTEFDFARGLRSLLRQDPEVIMIGEVRDRETAAIAIEAALTGHLVFSTLHAGSACGCRRPLLDMGIEPYLLTSGLKGILNQRLVRRLCNKCPPQASGCDVCAGTGYSGRILVAELANARRAAASGDPEQIRYECFGVGGKSSQT